MRILNILPYSPCPPQFGGALRVFHLLREMARRHRVTIIMYGTPDEGRLVSGEFPGMLDAVHTVERPPNLGGARKRWAQVRSLFRATSATTEAFYSDAMQATIRRVASDRSFDLVQTENHVLGLFDVPSDGAPLVMDAQNVEHDNVRRMARASNSPIRRAFYAGEYRKLRAEERGVYGRQDALLVTSARDKSLMDADVPGVPTYIIPNGVDTSYFAPRADAPERHTLVFTGAMNYFPNADGAVYFLKEIFPLVLHEVPDARVLIVGNGPPKQLLAMAADNVTVTGHVEDVRPYVRRAAVYVVPLRMGGGTRLKVLEALAMKKPVVTTRVGCEGIGVEHRTSVLIADAPGEFAGAVIGLLRDRDLAARLASNGHELIRASYRWPAIGALLDEAYGAILARHRMRTPAARVPAAGALHS